MDNNNYAAHRSVISLGKDVTRKTIDVSNRRFVQSQLRRVK